MNPYEALTNAVILKAAKDYRASWKKKNGADERRQIRDFFRSRLFANITDVNPDYLIERLEAEHQ
ncbi:MAG: hypothetical protein IKH16_10435 [Selenomonadaceae bacterium]|nr:hypothetical protein [Selenomonadaceae bacterium]